VQRNSGIDALADVDVVFFFDDDAVVRHDYLANALAFLEQHPDVLAITGRVLLDGVTTGEIDRPTATAALTASEGAPLSGAWRRTRQLYGCNFAYRIGSAPDVRFDDRLPLYSWLEDHDFARQLGRHGLLAEVDDCVIVHRAAASGGRQQHTRLGYSQVANPLYLWRKGSFPAWLAARELLRPVAKNLTHARPGPDSGWRRERLRGNLLALGDVARGRLTLERVRDL
jgi:GT2 family glycosyltransferase